MQTMQPNEFLETIFRGTTELDRDSLFLRFYSSYSIPDIADTLCISHGKARLHCRRGVRKVMKNLLDAMPVPKISIDEIFQLELTPSKTRGLSVMELNAATFERKDGLDNREDRKAATVEQQRCEVAINSHLAFVA